MEVICSRQMTIMWGQPPAAANEEDETISSSSSINHTKEVEGANSVCFSRLGFSTKQKGRDHNNASARNIGDNTEYRNDDSDAVDIVVDEDGLELCNMQQAMQMMRECSMCGYVGLPQYLFKCISCSHRFQHIYCSNMYPYRVEAAICNWCLPMKPEIAVDEEEDDDSVYNQHISVISNTVTNSDSKPLQQGKQIKKHSKAFEYLLQVIADLADERCHWPTELAVDGDYQRNHCRHGDINDVGHDQISNICTSQEVGSNHISRNHKNSDANHQIVSLQDQNNMIQEFLIEGKSFTAGTKEAPSYNGALSDQARSPLKRPRCHVDDMTGSKPMKATEWRDYDQVIRESTDYNKIYDNKAGYDQDMWIQNNCLTDDEEKADAAGSNLQSKRLRSTFKKQLMGVASGADCNSKPIKVANQPESFPLVQRASAQKIDGGGDDDGHHVTSAPVRNAKQPEATAPLVTTSTWPVQSKPVVGAGKRDHLTNSPSRAFNRRYKLLADVLC